MLKTNSVHSFARNNPPATSSGGDSTVQLVLNCDGTTVTDTGYYKRTVYATNFVTKTAKSVYGTKSGFSDPSLKPSLVQAIVPAIAQQDFCLEFWVCPFAYYSSQGLVELDFASLQVYVHYNGVQRRTLTVVGGDSCFMPVPPTYTWSHYAVSRQGNTLRFFYNGTLQGTVTTQSIYSLNYDTLSVGTVNWRNTYPASGNACYYNGIRLIVGRPVYTDSFTPLNTPL